MQIRKGEKGSNCEEEVPKPIVGKLSADRLPTTYR